MTTSQATNEAAAREAIEANEGLRRIGRMVGLESIRRNLLREDNEIERDNALNREAIWGEDEGTDEVSDPDDMHIMAARDVVLPPQGQSAPQASGISPTTAAVLGALTTAGLGTGVIGAGLAAYALSREPSSAGDTAAGDTRNTIRFVEESPTGK